VKDQAVYSKKVTSEEAREGYVLVLKNRLSYFPPVRKSFSLVRDGHSRKARVESYPCNCRGPEDPHKHFFIRSGGLRVGDRVVIRREASRKARYLLLVHRKRSL
jgi:hypothetical protein